MIPREIELQEGIEKLLSKRDLCPSLVFYTTRRDGYIDQGVLGISFYTPDDLQELLKIIEYRSLCDKSGYIVIEEYNTILVTEGSHILDLWTKL